MLLPIAVLIISLALIEISRVTSAANRLSRDAQALQGLTENGSLALIQSNPPGDIEASLTQTIQDFRDLRASVGWLVYLGPLFGWMPRYGGDLANAPALFDFGERVAVSAQDLQAIGQSLSAEIDKGRASGEPVGASVLRATQSQSALIQRAQQNFAALSGARARIDAAPLSPSLRDLLYRLDRWLPLWQAGLDGLADAPTLLGADRPRAYLLVAQNSDELRATGGFITGVSLLRIDQGKISVSDYQDSYAVDDLTKVHPIPPAPLEQYMYAGALLFRDANWSPDFPTTALQLQAIYQIDQNVTVDGVIAVNQQLLPQVLGALGPVTIDAYNERVDGGNVMAKIQEYWASPQGIGQAADWWVHRKDFTGKLFEVMMRRLTSGDFERTKVTAALLEGILSKDLLIYVNDSNAASSLARDGALSSGPGDALMIVDSNVGFNKVDGNVQRQAEYAVALDSSGAARATLTITYTNLSAPSDSFCVHQPYYLTNYADLQQGCYWDYVRVIAPGRSELVDATPELYATAELLPQARASFGGYFFVPRAERKTIRFEYRAPAVLKDGSSYTLRLEKQSGAPTMPVLVHIALPDGWRVQSANPVPTRAVGNAVEFAVTLDRDQDIRILFDRSLPPVVAVGGILALGLAGGIIFLLYRRNARAKAPEIPA